MQHQKEQFLKSYPIIETAKTPEEFALKSAIVSSVRRNPTYSSGLCLSRKHEIIDFWKQEIIKRSDKYFKTTKTIDEYIDDVLEMKGAINAHFCEGLKNSISLGLRVSHCQKSLSVYLKYMWCYNITSIVPPACPIDRIVLTHCGISDIAWTRLNDKKKFRKILSIIEKTRHNNGCCRSIAEWELCLFNSARGSKY